MSSDAPLPTPLTRVCPECGEPAGAQPFCAVCGLNLSAETRLPSRRDWEDSKAGSPEGSDTEPSEIRACADCGTVMGATGACPTCGGLQGRWVRAADVRDRAAVRAAAQADRANATPVFAQRAGSAFGGGGLWYAGIAAVVVLVVVIAVASGGGGSAKIDAHEMERRLTDTTTQATCTSSGREEFDCDVTKYYDDGTVCDRGSMTVRAEGDGYERVDGGVSLCD